MRKKLQGLVRLFRFELPFTAGICVVLGELLALGEIPAARELMLGFASVFLISASSLILNDYFDLESDRINAPERPLPAGLVTGRDVILLFIGVTFVGLVASTLLSFISFWVGILAWTVGFLYNWRFKKSGLPGNLMVSFSVGTTFIFGGIAVGKPLEAVVWFFGILAALINLGEEIAADAMDVEGDRKAGSRSLPVLFGQETALRFSAAIFLLVIVISIVPFVLGWMEWLYVTPFLFMDGVILFSTNKLLNPKLANRRRYIRWIYLSASLAILIVIIIRFLK
ncbi:MAG: 1,4-dihydroxy-2-naphthoate octaprenyltransferase [Anaerolineae bacterium]|nr:1,4-dihydroxy-2-naphthoate octaprenyltransferase [Anaerolineae bacterium]